MTGMDRRFALVAAFLTSCGSEGERVPGPVVDCQPFIPSDGADQDADGLLDVWETSVSGLDPSNPDTDFDGVLDGDEDEDQDRLTAREEFLASTFASYPSGQPPRLDQATLLVELDFMRGFALEERALQIVRDAFLASDIDVRFLVDECDLPLERFDGSFAQRQAFFADHQAKNVPAELADSLVHVVFAARRLDERFRPGEAISDGFNRISRSGLFVYFEPILDANPRCPQNDAPALQVFEAVGGTLTHELGHALQLGHDTELGGGTNVYNVMAQTTACRDAQRRHRGLGNHNPDLGSTQAVGRPRFSAAAIALMDLTARLSVDTGQLVDGIGRDM